MFFERDKSKFRTDTVKVYEDVRRISMLISRKKSLSVLVMGTPIFKKFCRVHDNFKIIAILSSDILCLFSEIFK